MSTTTHANPTDAVSRVDSDLVARAYRKLMDRKELTKQEREALKRHEKQKEENLRWGVLPIDPAEALASNVRAAG